jgi:hypothetical protein
MIGISALPATRTNSARASTHLPVVTSSCEWPIRRGMDRHASLRPIYEIEAHYVNSAGFWMAFSTAAMALREEALAKPDPAGVEDAKKYDVWGMMGVL